MPQLDPLLLNNLVIILTFLLVISLFLTTSLLLRIKKLTRGSSGSFEKVLIDIQKTLEDYSTFKKRSTQIQETLEKRVSNIKGFTECYNFKAFDGLGGGKNSFVTAFVDDFGNGILISTIDTRDRVNIFAKQIQDWKSDRTLTEEEQEVLTKLKK